MQPLLKELLQLGPQRSSSAMKDVLRQLSQASQASQTSQGSAKEAQASTKVSLGVQKKMELMSDI